MKIANMLNSSLRFVTVVVVTAIFTLPGIGIALQVEFIPDDPMTLIDADFELDDDSIMAGWGDLILGRYLR